jgi:predicted MFS family arabinose efflux permease
MGQSWGQQIIAVIAGILLTMLIVWITMPNEEERLINKKCFRACKHKVETLGYNMSMLSGPAYIDAIRTCHAECSSVIRK